MYSVNDLPLFSPWPARLLGLETFTSSKKNLQEIEREFGREKWGKLLVEIKNGNITTIEEADSFFASDTKLLVSDHNEFLVMTSAEAGNRYISVLLEHISRLLPASAIVELGSGYGSTILNLAKKIDDPSMSYYALELTTSGTQCSQFLSDGIPGKFTHGNCNFLSQEIFDTIIPENSIIFTSFALHYIHGVPANFITKIRQSKPKAVLNLEPCFELWDKNTLYDLLKKKYMIANDYNASILSSLREYEAQSMLEITNTVTDVFGQNPLLPASVLVWK